MAPVFQLETALNLSAGLTSWLTLSKPFSRTSFMCALRFTLLPLLWLLWRLQIMGPWQGAVNASFWYVLDFIVWGVLNTYTQKLPSSCIGAFMYDSDRHPLKLSSTSTALFIAFLQCSLVASRMFLVDSHRVTFSWPVYLLPLCGTLELPDSFIPSLPSDLCRKYHVIQEGCPHHTEQHNLSNPCIALLYFILMCRLCHYLARVCILYVFSIRIQDQDGIFASWAAISLLLRTESAQ